MGFIRVVRQLAPLLAFDDGAGGPVGDGGLVLGAVERDARSSFGLAEGVAHHGDGLHGEFVVDVLGLD